MAQGSYSLAINPYLRFTARLFTPAVQRADRRVEFQRHALVATVLFVEEDQHIAHRHLILLLDLLPFLPRHIDPLHEKSYTTIYQCMQNRTFVNTSICGLLGDRGYIMR